MLELNFDITMWCRPRKSGKALGITLLRRREALCVKSMCNIKAPFEITLRTCDDLGKLGPCKNISFLYEGIESPKKTIV